ncbi:MAG: selenocysteine-specific translation elongation factor [Chloroflexota bacterium]|nr:selenocysteine-specific translation elongation factor [Chloroflexota bacterium]
MRVIGTAGHVDHGKSTLVKRLTGIDPDRLAEEQAREMTIDLGFAWLPLANGELLGIVDVPGHRDFIENMLAGVGGIDAALLIIAADEGVMPQTREHLAILQLLGIERTLIAMTKIDMVDDADWLALIEQDIRSILSSTPFADVPLYAVSARTGTGIPELISAIEQLVAHLPLRSDTGQPRLPIDRVFTMPGFGTVVTGTLTGGALRLGDEVVLQPTGIRGRIRTLQSYRHSVQVALPGSRVAVNLAGVDQHEAARGSVLTLPDLFQPTTRIDIQYAHLPDADSPLAHNDEVKLFSGTAEVASRTRVLGADIIAPGETGWLQLELHAPLTVARGDRVILRRPSPPETIGGGIIIDPYPPQRWKRFRSEVLESLALRLRGTPAERIAQLAETSEPIKRTALQQAAGLAPADFDAALHEALADRHLISFPNDTFLSAARTHALLNRIIGELDAFHRANPLKAAMPREALRSRIGIRQATLTALLAMQTDVLADEHRLRLSSHHITFTQTQQALVDQLSAQMDAAPYTPPSYTDAAAMVGSDVLDALIELGIIVRVQPDVIFARAAYKTLLTGTLRLIDEHGQVTAAMLRDTFGTSRKYAIGLLEYLDAQGITQRVGDARVRKA